MTSPSSLQDLSHSDLLLSKRALSDSLGTDNMSKYVKILKKWFKHQITKDQFDLEAKALLPNNSLMYHNAFLLAILNKSNSLIHELGYKADKLIHDEEEKLAIKQRLIANLRKRKISSFEQTDPCDFNSVASSKLPIEQIATSFASHDQSLPDVAMIHGRSYAIAWDNGLEHVDSSVIRILFYAVEYQIKRILMALIKSRTSFLLREGHFPHAFGSNSSRGNPYRLDCISRKIKHQLSRTCGGIEGINLGEQQLLKFSSDGEPMPNFPSTFEAEEQEELYFQERSSGNSTQNFVNNSSRTNVRDEFSENVRMSEDTSQGWRLVQHLGEGAYGQVKLAVNSSNEAIAIKMIRTGEGAADSNNIKKEIIIQKMLRHENIVRFFGSRFESPVYFLFLEYVGGGELFDRIEPDVGMKKSTAQSFFLQLLGGLHYMHCKGVTHRDIKPENLLITNDDVLKITDFGFATVFKFKNMHRLIDKCCGTKPYVAPEVLRRKPYRAEPADIWSCLIVLIAMLTGELPWDEPTDGCSEYQRWKTHYISISPWNKLTQNDIALFRKVLNADPEKRLTIPQLQSHPWCLADYSVTTSHKKLFSNITNNESTILSHSPQSKRRRMNNDSLYSGDENESFKIDRGLSSCSSYIDSEDTLNDHCCLSQPESEDSVTSLINVESPKMSLVQSFSQPYESDSRDSDMLISNSNELVQPLGEARAATSQGDERESSKFSLQQLVRRMTRFSMKLSSIEDAINLLSSKLKGNSL